MFAFILVTLLFANTVSGAEQTNPVCEMNKYSITLSERNIKAEAGLCVVLPCSIEDNLEVKSIMWYKYNGTSNETIFSSSPNTKIQSEFKGRVSLLESDLIKTNCSITIKDLTKSDSGSYRLRVAVNETKNACTFTSEANITVTVTDLSQKPTVVIPPMTEGQQTTLTCTAPGLCSGSTPDITWTWRGVNGTDITGNITEFKTHTAVSKRYSSTLTFNASAEHHHTKITCKVSFKGGTTTEETKTLNVTYLKELKISGHKAVKKGDTLNLTCSSDGFPAYFIKWTKSDSNKILNKEIGNKAAEGYGSASLIILNMTAELSGQYICTATHLNETIMKTINITYSSSVLVDFPRILNGSGCVVQSEVLTCVCISEGFPLPTIKWLSLESHTECSVMTRVSNHTVNSTFTVSEKHHCSSTIVCVSSNDAGEAKEDLTITKCDLSAFQQFLRIVKDNQVIVAAVIGFLIGVLLSAFIACFVTKSRRKKQRRSENLSENLEMVTTEPVPMMDADHIAVYDGIREPEEAEGEAESAGQSPPDGDVAPKEVEYSNIDFSAIKNRNPEEAEKTQGTADTEYAEIKKERRPENAQEDSEMLEGNEEEQVMIGEDNEVKQAEEEGGEDVALYSSVDEIMG